MTENADLFIGLTLMLLLTGCAVSDSVVCESSCNNCEEMKMRCEVQTDKVIKEEGKRNE